MNTKETLLESLANPDSKFRNEMNSWWADYISNKTVNNEREQEENKKEMI